MTKLEHYFLEIPDSRRPAGRRYKLSKLLLALTLGVLSGYQGCRELARFVSIKPLKTVEVQANKR